MEISIARTMKEKLEKYIEDGILLFQKETGLQVDDIKLQVIPMYTGYNENPGGVIVTIKVKI